MKYLYIKMFRDVKTNWTQFVSVFLMSMISVLIFSGMSSVWTGINHQAKQYVKESNMADSWVTAKGITSGDVNELMKIDDVEDVTLNMNIFIDLDNQTGELSVNAPDNLNVSKPIVLKGKEFKIDSEGIWIDRDYAQKHELQLGETVSFTGYDGVVELVVQGIIMSPEYIYYTGAVTETVPDYNKYGYAYISENTMKKIYPNIVFTEAKLKLKSNISENDVMDIFGDRYIFKRDRESYINYNRVNQESKQMQKMATLFSAVFILLALLTMYTSMVRLVNNQIIQIGVFKAIGISSRKIRIHYSLYGLFVPLLGGIVGLIIGRFTVSQALIKVKQSTLALPEWELIYSKISFLVIAIMVLICMFSAVWAAKNGLKGMPAETMRGNIQKNRKEKGGNVLSDKIPYFWRWVFRDIVRNKARFLMGIIGVTGGMVLIIAGLGISDSITTSNEYVYSQQYDYDSKGLLSIPGKTFEIDNEHQWLQEEPININENVTKNLVIVVCDEGDLIKFKDDNDKDIIMKNEGAIISRKVAKDFGIKKGDTIKFRMVGDTEWINVNITDISKTLTPQGVFMSKSAYETLGKEFRATSILINDIKPEELVEKDDIKIAISKEQQYENTKTIANSVMSIVKLLIMASILLSVVILYNLGILSFVERTREYATMKVIGFYQSEIRSIAIRDCLLSTLIGWIIGIPLGIKFLQVYIDIVSFDSFEWISSVKLPTLIIASVVIIGTSILVNLRLSSKVNKINMVEALKSVE